MVSQNLQERQVLHLPPCHRVFEPQVRRHFPYNGHSDISEKLDYIFNMTEGERLKTKDKGYERLTQFSWEKSATEYAQVYKSLL